MIVLTDTAYPVGRQDRHFYFRLLFLLSRKASNATIKLPKDISNANIPMKIEMISKAVIGATSLPMYSGTPVFINSGGYHPVMGTFRRCIVTRRYMNGNQFFKFVCRYHDTRPKSSIHQIIRAILEPTGKKQSRKRPFYQHFQNFIRYSNSTFPN